MRPPAEKTPRKRSILIDESAVQEKLPDPEQPFIVREVRPKPAVRSRRRNAAVARKKILEG